VAVWVLGKRGSGGSRLQVGAAIQFLLIWNRRLMTVNSVLSSPAICLRPCRFERTRDAELFKPLGDNNNLAFHSIAAAAGSVPHSPGAPAQERLDGYPALGGCVHDDNAK
jgi:hypothetical protein